MRADLALIGFILTLAGGITLLVLRRRRGGVPLLLGGIVLLLGRSRVRAVSGSDASAGAGSPVAPFAKKEEK